MKNPAGLGGCPGAQQLHHAEPGDSQAEGAEHDPDAARVERPEREQGEHHEIHSGAVGAFPGRALAAGPDDREVGPAGVGGKQQERGEHRARQPARHTEREQGHDEQAQQEEPGRIPSGGVKARLGGPERDQNPGRDQRGHECRVGG